MLEAAVAYHSFAKLAAEWCELAERYSPGKANSLRRLQISLATLHASAIQLPHVELKNGSVRRNKDLIPQSRALYARLAQDLPFDSFQCVWTPLEKEAPALTGSLADALASIWYDLKTGLVQLESAHPEQHAEVWWQWRFSFETHWGKHALEALSALHDSLRDI